MRMSEVIVVDGKTRELGGRNGREKKTAWGRLNEFRAGGHAYSTWGPGYQHSGDGYLGIRERPFRFGSRPSST